MRWGLGGFAASAAIALLGAALWHGWVVVPDRWNPWAPLWPLEAPNGLTPYKLARLADDPAGCMAALRASRLAADPVPDRPVVNGCGWTAAVRVSALPARLGPPIVLTCPAALSLALWERHTVQRLALEHIGAPLAGLEHYGSFACRDIGGSAGRGGHEGGGRRSEHATANALDVAGFSFADGTVVSVARDWSRGDDDRRGRFLRALHAESCRLWQVVLGPDYNAAHRDHYHLDRGRFRACR